MWTRVLQCVYCGGSTRECALSRVQRRGATVCTAQAGFIVIVAEPLVFGILASVALQCRLIHNAWLLVSVTVVVANVQTAFPEAEPGIERSLLEVRIYSPPV